MSSMPVCQQWQYTEVPHNRVFLFADFHVCLVRMVLHQGQIISLKICSGKM